jgi:putative ABC transport system substrate-binding protein
MPGQSGANMRRREFIAGGIAAAWPLAAHAQPPALPVIGFLHNGAPETFAGPMAAFRKGLSEAGFVEGQNVAIEYRWARNDSDQDHNRLPELLADLVRRRVAVIVTPTNTATAVASKAATNTIPIVFGVATDPVEAGLVSSLNRPGGNVTGFASLISELGAKRLGLLRELLPSATRFALLVNPGSPLSNDTTIKDVQSAAATFGRPIEVVTASSSRDLDAAFASVAEKRSEALLVNANSIWMARRVQIATLAARHMLPTIYPVREFVEAGGLMSYGPSNADRYRQIGAYTGRILKGEKAADLPVIQAAKFEFIINLPTARAIGLTIPPTLLARADEVIE